LLFIGPPCIMSLKSCAAQWRTHSIYAICTVSVCAGCATHKGPTSIQVPRCLVKKFNSIFKI